MLIFKVCSNLVHSIDRDNSNIALENSKGAVLPPMTITPLPVGDVTIECIANLVINYKVKVRFIILKLY